MCPRGEGIGSVDFFGGAKKTGNSGVNARWESSSDDNAEAGYIEGAEGSGAKACRPVNARQKHLRLGRPLQAYFALSTVTGGAFGESGAPVRALANAGTRKLATTARAVTNRNNSKREKPWT